MSGSIGTGRVYHDGLARVQRNMDYSFEGAPVRKIAEICRETLQDCMFRNDPVLSVRGLDEEKARILISPLTRELFGLVPSNGRHDEVYKQDDGTYMVHLKLYCRGEQNA